MPPSTDASPAWFGGLVASAALDPLVSNVEAGGGSSCRGAAGSSTAFAAAALALRSGRPVLLVVAHLDEADEAAQELAGLSAGGAPLDVLHLPALEALPGESVAAADLLADRLAVVRRLVEGDPPRVLVAALASLMQPVPGPETLPRALRRVRAGTACAPRELAAWLAEAGYSRTEAIESPGEFAVRGGVMDVFPPGGGLPVRLDFFGDELERIFEVDLATQASDRRVDAAQFVALTGVGTGDDGTVPFHDLLAPEWVAVVAELAEVMEQGRGYWERVSDGAGISAPQAVFKALGARCHALVDVNGFSAANAASRVAVLPVERLPAFDEDVARAFGEVAALAASRPVALCCDSEGELARARELLAQHAAGTGARVAAIACHVHRGFTWDPDGPSAVAVVPQREVLHRWGSRRRVQRVGAATSREAFLQFGPGDYVVHRDHGIARFHGLQSIAAGDGQGDEEFLTLEFDAGARMHVPASKIDLVQKYVGAGGARPPLSALGGKRWKAQKERVQEAVRDLAGEMLRIQAARESTSGIRYPDDTEWMREFEADFPWTETEDQVTAIAAVKRDMQAPRPMDRLICGDVGFGKTEVAIRAAFKAVESGRQVAVLVPTTVLAEQHERTFRDRFRAYPFRIESLSRFKTGAECTRILEDVAKGGVDVVIGTHRLLSQDVRFADLGLVVVDEEQRFGVEHKQRLLAFRLTADVLTLSATPIPRTLHMSLMGLRDISSLTTPPPDRRAIVTEVLPWNPRRVQEAIRRELAREGQVFFVHNRVHDIEEVAAGVKDLVPEARVIVGHGQMTPAMLEQVMLAFMRHEADILVSTTIIESGIDIPTANTMIIHDADIYGLAELHQLRGRVGRSRHRAYCYLMLPADRTITEDAMKRLKAIEDYSMLGAGFRIAMRDLEIRGAGNLLGAEQSGHIATVGYEMYCQLLEQAVGDLRSEERVVPSDTVLDIGVAASIPRGYVPSDLRRMEAYRRIAAAKDAAQLAKVRADLESAYGAPPPGVETLLALADLRLGATLAGVRSVARREQDVVFRALDAHGLRARLAGIGGTVRVVGQADERGLTDVFWRPAKGIPDPRSLLRTLHRRIGAIALSAPAEAISPAAAPPPRAQRRSP
jgi:transcription-repair coupling factor (superfamily II helicase)